MGKGRARSGRPFGDNCENGSWNVAVLRRIHEFRGGIVVPGVVRVEVHVERGSDEIGLLEVHLFRIGEIVFLGPAEEDEALVILDVIGSETADPDVDLVGALDGHEQQEFDFARLVENLQETAEPPGEIFLDLAGIEIHRSFVEGEREVHAGAESGVFPVEFFGTRFVRRKAPRFFGKEFFPLRPHGNVPVVIVHVFQNGEQVVDGLDLHVGIAGVVIRDVDLVFPLAFEELRHVLRLAGTVFAHVHVEPVRVAPHEGVEHGKEDGENQYHREGVGHGRKGLFLKRGNPERSSGGLRSD